MPDDPGQQLQPSGPAPGDANVEIRWAAGEADLGGAIALRKQVFCGEQGVAPEQEIDGLDEQAAHLVALETGGGPVVGTLRLFVAGEQAKIGRVAVRRDWRRQGIASVMLEAALADARRRGCTRARLAAQLRATELYAHAGFTVCSAPFVEAGITHVWMERPLEPEGEGVVPGDVGRTPSAG
jgi:predicted GNAT family N-acyltransferase